MQKNTHNSSQPQVNPHLALDQCRIAFMAGITTHFMRLFLDYDSLPASNRVIVKQTLEQLDKCIREVKRTAIPHNPHYLDRNLKRAKILDIATVVDLMARVGMEESPEVYEEFLGFMVDCMDAVLYAQQHRRKMHFGKYKALFSLLASEIKADVNNEPGQLLYTSKKELFIRSYTPPHEPVIK